MRHWPFWQRCALHHTAATSDDRPDVGAARADLAGRSCRFRFSRRTATARRARTRFWSILLIAIVNFFNLASVLLLVAGFFHPEKAASHPAGVLLRTGAQIWATNILVFALWFWELDGDGPEARAHASAATEVRKCRLSFSADADGDRERRRRRTQCIDPRWKPQFLDYLYLAFTNSTAFSPTDAMPLSRWAKVLMTFEALISLITIAIVVARSINAIV